MLSTTAGVLYTSPSVKNRHFTCRLCTVALLNRVSPELRRELGIENQPVKLFAYKSRIEVLSEKLYEERKREAAQTAADDVSKLEAAGLN